jgi:hypothetical protein
MKMKDFPEYNYLSIEQLENALQINLKGYESQQKVIRKFIETCTDIKVRKRSFNGIKYLDGLMLKERQTIELLIKRNIANDIKNKVQLKRASKSEIKETIARIKASRQLHREMRENEGM